jgi:hypothetical protein
MVASVFGAAGSHNDVGVLNLSGLVEYLETTLYLDHEMEGGLLPALYTDAIFLHIIHTTIITRVNIVGNMQKQAIICKLNSHMSGGRQCIEHMYGELFNLFHLLKTLHQMKLFSSGQTAYCLRVISLFILNCYTCLNGSACNSMFETTPPTLEQYIPLDEELQLYVPNDNLIYDYYILN